MRLSKLPSAPTTPTSHDDTKHSDAPNAKNPHGAGSHSGNVLPNANQAFTGKLTVTESAVGNTVLAVQVSGDTFARSVIEAGGLLAWGTGSAAGDIDLMRDGVGALYVQSVPNGQATLFKIRPTTGTAPAVGQENTKLALMNVEGANEEYLLVRVLKDSQYEILSTKAGAGTLRPIVFKMDATEVFRIQSDGTTKFSTAQQLAEIIAPGTPAANTLYLYAKDKAGVSTLYYKKDDGTEIEIGSGGGGLTDRIQDADNDTFDDAEVGTDPDFVTHGRAATTTAFDKWLKGAETQPRVQLNQDGIMIGDGTATPDVDLRRVAADILGLHGVSGTSDALEFISRANPSTPASNAARLFAKTVGASTQLAVILPSGAIAGPLGDKGQATTFGKGPSGGVEPPLSTTWSDGVWGTLAPAGSWTPTGTPSVADDTAVDFGRHLNFQTGAVAGNDAGIETPLRFWPNKKDAFLCRFSLPTITSIRAFIGITNLGLATAVGADDPGTNTLGLQFSTPRGDVNWKFTERGTSTQATFDSGVAVSADPVYFQFLIDGSVWQMILLDKSFVPVAQRTVGVFGKPGGTTTLAIVVGIETQVAAARNLRIYHINHHARGG